MTRRDRITLLLEYLVDVEHGLPERDPVPQDDILALMCKAWNHESYRQLDRLLRVLWERWPDLHLALVRRYCRFEERRVAWCRKCGAYEHADRVGKSHYTSVVAGKKLYCRIGNVTVELLPRIRRVPWETWDVLRVERALEWLELHWTGEADIPPAVLAVESERRLRAA